MPSGVRLAITLYGEDRTMMDFATLRLDSLNRFILAFTSESNAIARGSASRRPQDLPRNMFATVGDGLAAI